MHDAIAIAAASPTDREEDLSRDERRCAYVIEGDDGRPRQFCGAPCRAGSAYCEPHHARCHLSEGSPAEQRQLREIEALAAAAGGRQARLARQPSSRMLKRLERAVHSALVRPIRSRIVPKAGARDGNPTDNRKGGG